MGVVCPQAPIEPARACVLNDDIIVHVMGAWGSGTEMNTERAGLLSRVGDDCVVVNIERFAFTAMAAKSSVGTSTVVVLVGVRWNSIESAIRRSGVSSAQDRHCANDVVVNVYRSAKRRPDEITAGANASKGIDEQVVRDVDVVCIVRENDGVVGDSLNVSILKTQTLDASQESQRSELTSFIKEEAIESKDVADSNIQAEVLKIVLKALVSFY